MKLKKIFWICRQLKFDQFRIRSEIFILLEIMIDFNVWKWYSLSAQILILNTGNRPFKSWKFFKDDSWINRWNYQLKFYSFREPH